MKIKSLVCALIILLCAGIIISKTHRLSEDNIMSLNIEALTQCESHSGYCNGKCPTCGEMIWASGHQFE